MADVSNRELRKLDLTVLMVFLGLLRHRKATDVALELGLTQSAVSHSLKRLREVFQDELFLRRPHGMEPTAVALSLESPVNTAVEALRNVIGAPQSFDPTTAEGTITIGALDGEQATLLPGLIGILRRETPAIRVAARNIGRRAALDAMAAGEIDLCLGFFWDVDDAFIVDELYREDYLVVHRDAPVDRNGNISLDTYVSMSHILVSPAGDMKGVVDDLLGSRGLSRHVLAAIPTFLPALAVVQETGAIATLPRRIVEKHAASFQLRISAPPLPVRSFSISAVRHRRNDRNAMHRWLIDKLKGLAGPNR